LDKATLQILIDEIFAGAELAAIGHPMLQLAMKSANKLVDGVVLDLILTRLQARGVSASVSSSMTPSSVRRA
jgi:hypothetical protein